MLKRFAGGRWAVNERRTRLACAIAIPVTLAGGFLLRNELGIELDAESLRQHVESMGPLAPVLFVAAVSLRFVLLIPSALLLTVGGLAFGVVLGTVYGALGLTLMGLLQFSVVQLTGPEGLRTHIPARFANALQEARSWRGAATLAVLSAYPFGLQTPVQLAAAIAGMGLFTFLAAVAGGGILRAGLFSWLGSTLLEGERVLVGALLVAVVATPFVLPRARAVALSLLRPEKS